eukprot:6412495-Amphidinium_carterae.2
MLKSYSSSGSRLRQAITFVYKVQAASERIPQADLLWLQHGPNPKPSNHTVAEPGIQHPFPNQSKLRLRGF